MEDSMTDEQRGNGWALRIISAVNEHTDTAIGGVHRRIDKVVEGQHINSERLAKVETKIEGVCETAKALKESVNSHLGDHKTVRNIAIKELLAVLIPLVIAALVAGHFWARG